MSKRTYNFYVQAMKKFGHWAENDRRVTTSPVKMLSKITVEDHDTKHRRALDVEDLIKLLERTIIEPSRFGLSGPRRAMAYRLAAETGLRANEIRNLTVASFDLDKCTVAVLSAYTKNRKAALLPLKSDTAVELIGFLAGKLPNVRPFPLPDKTADMLKKDLKAAGIPYEDDSGHVFDFHSLRHQTGSLLAAAGVTPKVAQDLMRHSDIRMTMDIYTHTLTGQQSAAVESLPNLRPANDSIRQKKTGTDDAGALASCLAISNEKQRSDTKSNEEPNPFNDSEPPISLRPAGFEPATFGSVDRCSEF